MRLEKIERLRKVIEQWKQNVTETAPGLELEHGDVVGTFNGLRMRSVYQPLFEAQTQRLLAHEALLRVHDHWKQTIPPRDAFTSLGGTQDVVRFDRLCRVVHVLNFMGRSMHPGDLWLNVSADHLQSVHTGEHGRVFENLLRYCDLTPDRIVLEILESRIDNLNCLQEAVQAYRGRGYRVAIDDFGSRHSNFDRLWQLTPDIVKLDRSLMVQATDNVRARRILPRLIEIIHELGAMAVCEGIETETQLLMAQDAGADLVQGYYLARPGRHLWNAEDNVCLLAAQ